MDQTLFTFYKIVGLSEIAEMARPFRVEFPDAIYHVMGRGNGRQAIFLGEDDSRRLTDGLATTLGRTGWHVLTYVWMPNPNHLSLKTPQANLSLDMQYLLSGYANWYANRRHRSGHLFQGRFKAELVEDETYFWTLSRYVHFNPVRENRPLVTRPRDLPWSSDRSGRLSGWLKSPKPGRSRAFRPPK